MSASLVGSEMCIRDRVSNMPMKSSMPSTPMATTMGTRYKGPKTNPGSPCLLYTSDAADDM
eukprot:12876615-Alexandrium_andersonii.AAC.1